MRRCASEHLHLLAGTTLCTVNSSFPVLWGKKRKEKKTCNCTAHKPIFLAGVYRCLCTHWRITWVCPPAASCWAPGSDGLGCWASPASLPYCSSARCPSCRSPPASCCWREETSRPAREVATHTYTYTWTHLDTQRHTYRADLPHSGCAALRRLWGNKDYRQDLEEMLQEKVALQKVRSRSVLELLLDRTVRWQLLTIVVVFITLQLCGINAVSGGAGGSRWSVVAEA